MDQSPSRSTGKDTLSAGYRYKAVIVMTLAVSAVAYFAYLQPRIQSSPGAARDTNIDCNVGIQAADLGPDCPPLPAVAAATKPETANEWQPDPEEPAVTRGPAVGEISSDRTGTVKTSAWHTANDAFDQTDNRPRAGYTMAELCAAVGNASSQLHCEPIDSSRLVKSRNSRSIDSDLETYSIVVLQAYPQLAMFNMADERGNFLMPKKMPDGSKDNRRIICIGGGTGLAPFVSFAQHLHAVGDKRESIRYQTRIPFYYRRT